ncbi:hypothetical protein VT52_027940 [Streptomyces malaysiense]|uniref:Uncharacterized protein n=2 Tax=Streptomyces malaysiense TaxID=1428626 RepID=A0A1J4PWL3_9ACTN|nr:hypothetical protein VT52_027940 [Streptomyces malaysiense]
MPTRTRALRFTAVLAFVVLGLTGFSRGGHGGHGHGHGHGGGGGGCSSSRQDHDASSSSSSTSGGGSYDGTGDGTSGAGTTGGTRGTYRHRPTHGATPSASSSGGGSAPEDGRVRLIGCASAGKPYATVELTNPNDRRTTFGVEVSFQDRDGTQLDLGRGDVTVPANGTVRARVAYDAGYSTDLPDHCAAEPRAAAED